MRTKESLTSAYERRCPRRGRLASRPGTIKPQGMLIVLQHPSQTCSRRTRIEPSGDWVSDWRLSLQLIWNVNPEVPRHVEAPDEVANSHCCQSLLV